MHRYSKASRSARFVIALFLGLGLVTTAALVFEPMPAQAETEEELQAQKDHWQERYRLLLRAKAQLKENARLSRENYARAQRRNYPRGGARQQMIIQAEKAEAEIVTVEAEIDALQAEARREGALPRWLYDVEEEAIALPEPASLDSNASDASDASDDDEDDDRGGRNPLYFDDNDDS